MSMRNLTIALLILAGAVALPSQAFAGDRDRDGNRGRDRGPEASNPVPTRGNDVARNRSDARVRVAIPFNRGHRSGHVDIYRDRRDHGRRRPAFRVVRWTQGHWEDRTVRVWVEATYRTEYVPPVYEERRGRHGRIHRILVRAGYNRTVCIPGHYENRVQRFWVAPRPIYHR